MVICAGLAAAARLHDSCNATGVHPAVDPGVTAAMSPRESSTTGLEAHVAGALAYLAGPLSGVLVLLAERTNPFVRFHAWQSVVGLGGLGLLVMLLFTLAFASIVVSARIFWAVLIVSWVTWGLWIVCWAVCLFKAYTRRRWKLPVAGTYAERLAARVPTRTT